MIEEPLEIGEQGLRIAFDCGSGERQGIAVLAMKYFFKAYATDAALRAIIDDKRFSELNVNPAFGVGDLRAVPPEWRDGIPEYVKDYVPLNQFM